MDPIHPIAPVPPNIPPVAPPPLIGGIGRDDRRRGLDQDKRRRRRTGPSPTDPILDERDGDDDSGLHINVTA
jgi:hypothetical protein